MSSVKKAKELTFVRQVHTSSAQLQNRSLHVVDNETGCEMYRRRNKHVQSVQKYLSSLLNMQICDVRSLRNDDSNDNAIIQWFYWLDEET